LKCFEDEHTNRLIEGLKVFEELVNSKYENIKKYEIIFTKKDILINMIKNDYDFKNLYDLGFNKEITFKNIVQFHIDLFTQFLKKNNDLKLNFYCSCLIDLDESRVLYQNIMDHILFNSEVMTIDFPNIFNFKIYLFTFQINFDILFIFEKKNYFY
jgi:hypothetical protein